MNTQGTSGGSVTGVLPEPLGFRDVLRLKDPEAKTKKVYFLYCAGFVKIGMGSSIVRRMGQLRAVTERILNLKSKD